MPDHSQIHSTGRGGAGNIGEDTSTYVDGAIVREGYAHESHRPEYSAGRGGAGNMVEPPRHASPAPRSEDVVPEPAMRSGEGYENYHTGRGGQGNVHKEKYGGHSSSGEQQREHHKGEDLVEKVKHVVGLDKHKPLEGKEETK
ncbi:Protein of unknown function (DUF3602) [Teratosphaeria destructans]|uniref:Uncharacterized protein n=1 Tax=Teratosphaeria destructans TaxID=418781 RepID=A0A9W7VYU7_9PEZI|nr:Protein of unknown function (DUF3602) [Teratosphaeria destructans]